MEKETLFHNSEFLKKLIPSKTMRNYIAKTGWMPTEFQLTALISHMNISLEEKEAYWTAIAQETEDQVLREQVQETLRRRKRAFDLFAAVGESIYTVEVEAEDRAFGYFLSFDQALEAGRQLHRPFEIRKYPFGPPHKRPIGALNPFMGGDAPGQEVLDDIRSPLEAAAVGSILYDAAGQAVDWWQALDADPEVTPGEAARREYDPARFENAYVPLPNPFDRGEIVAILDQQGKVKNYGLVWNTEEGWEVSHQQEGHRDYWDETIVVEFIDKEDGDFTHSHINPFYLERAEPEDETTRKYLLEGQELLRGRGSMQDLFWARDAYREAHCGKNEED